MRSLAAPVTPHTDTRSRLLRAVPALIALVLGLVAAFSLAAPASAATPCGKRVLGDWFDNGRIDRIYPLNCYEEAIDAIPNDIRDYADAEDVITRALQSALRGKLDPVGGKDPSPGARSADGGANDSGGGSVDQQAAPDVNASGPSSVPVPLLVLGGLSLALLAAGGLGYLSRRRQAARTDDVDDVDPLP